jgi:hypothetical protein
MKKLMFPSLKPAKLALAATLLLAFTSGPVLAGVHNPGVLPPNTHPYGKSYAEWSVKWWQWVLSLPANNNPILDTGDCSAGQFGPVRFLVGAFVPTTETRACTISAGTALFFPVYNAWADNTGCPYTTLSAAELVGLVEGFMGFGVNLSCTIDGVPVQGVSSAIGSPYLVGPQVFSYTVAQTDNILANYFGLSCIADGTTVAPAAEDGVYLMLAPLSPGHHVIHFIVPGFLDITYNLAVVPWFDCHDGENQ